MAREDLKYLEKFERDREKRINKSFPSLEANKMKPKKEKNNKKEITQNESNELTLEEAEEQMKPFHILHDIVVKGDPKLFKKMLREIDNEYT